METLADNEVIPLKNCEHVFHAECIKEFIKSQVENSKFPIVCPEAKCKQTLNDIDIEDMLGHEAYIKFNQFQLKNVLEVQKDVSWCPTPDCKFAFVFDEEDKKNNF